MLLHHLMSGKLKRSGVLHAVLHNIATYRKFNCSSVPFLKHANYFQTLQADLLGSSENWEVGQNTTETLASTDSKAPFNERETATTMLPNLSGVIVGKKNASSCYRNVWDVSNLNGKENVESSFAHIKDIAFSVPFRKESHPYVFFMEAILMQGVERLNFSDMPCKTNHSLCNCLLPPAEPHTYCARAPGKVGTEGKDTWKRWDLCTFRFLSWSWT